MKPLTVLQKINKITIFQYVLTLFLVALHTHICTCTCMIAGGAGNSTVFLSQDLLMKSRNLFDFSQSLQNVAVLFSSSKTLFNLLSKTIENN